MSAAELRALAADLDRAAKAIRKRAVEVGRESASDIADAYRARARRETGAMADSVTIRAKGLKVEVGPTAYYAVFNEEGTSSIQGDGVMRAATDAEVPDWQEQLAAIPEEAL